MNYHKDICNLNPFYDLVFDNEVEFCGLFNSIDNCLVIDNNTVTVGYETNGRKACIHKRYSKLIWHTHPYSSHSYPSREDVFKVLKRDVIENSIIFTRWGIWQIKFIGFLELDLERESKKLNEYEKIIYLNTERGKVNILNNRQLKYIHYYIEKLQNRYQGLTVRFDRWEDLYDNTLFII
jgi:hypothetical protein